MKIYSITYAELLSSNIYNHPDPFSKYICDHISMEKFLTHNQTRLWTISEGNGTATIFLNGGPGCDDYLGQVSSMIEDICEVVRFEPRGCGRSIWDGHYDLATNIEDIEFIRKQYGFEQVLLVGHSWGPDLGLAYLLKYPGRVLGLIGLAGGRIVNDRDWHAAYSAGSDAEHASSPFEFHADPEVNVIGNATYKEFIKQPGLLEDISKISCPVTYIGAGNDIRPNWPARQLAALIKNGRYKEIPEASHYIWITHSQELSELLRATIREMVNQH
jgi:proline iminopeptidase